MMMRIITAKVIVVVREALFSVVREQCREMSVQSPSVLKATMRHFYFEIYTSVSNNLKIPNYYLIFALKFSNEIQ